VLRRVNESRAFRVVGRFDEHEERRSPWGGHSGTLAQAAIPSSQRVMDILGHG